MKEFSFVIARPWDKNRPNELCTYMYQNSEVHNGNIVDATILLDYVNQKEEEEYFIYKVQYIKIHPKDTDGNYF